MREPPRGDLHPGRRTNLGTVLRHVADRGPGSRATIAVETGLTKSTVSSVVGVLIDLGLLREATAAPARAVGRPGRLVELRDDSVAALGLEVNVDYRTALAMDLTGRVRARSVVEEDHRGSDPETVLGKLADQARDVIAALARDGLRPAGATLAVPGLVDEAAGRLMLAPNLRWRDVPVGDLVGAALGLPSLPVRVDNEANLAAYAEFRERSGRGVRDLVHVSGQIGVGAGVIADGTPFRGSRGFAGELGHITVDLDGPPCACGNRGCLETVVGQEALLRRARITVPTGVPSRRLTATLVQRALAGDAGTLNALRAGGKALGVALATVANLCDPQVIVLGGSYAELAPWLVPPVRSELRGRVLAARWSPIDVEVSTLGPEAAALGAASLVVGDILADPEAVPVQAA